MSQEISPVAVDAVAAVAELIAEGCDEVSLPWSPNRFGGFDVRFDSGTVRLAAEDLEAGLELYVLSPNGWCLVDVQFRQAPSTIIAGAVVAAIRERLAV